MGCAKVPTDAIGRLNQARAAVLDQLCQVSRRIWPGRCYLGVVYVVLHDLDFARRNRAGASHEKEIEAKCEYWPAYEAMIQ